MSFPGLLLSILQPDRLAEAQALAPNKSISFQGQTWPERWTKIYYDAKNLRLSQFRIDKQTWSAPENGKGGARNSMLA